LVTDGFFQSSSAWRRSARCDRTSRAVDLFWFYFGYASHFTLHDDNGWSYEQAKHWLVDQACRETFLEI
jgi:hypothetical protein